MGRCPSSVRPRAAGPGPRMTRVWENVPEKVTLESRIPGGAEGVKPGPVGPQTGRAVQSPRWELWEDMMIWI